MPSPNASAGPPPVGIDRTEAFGTAGQRWQDGRATRSGKDDVMRFMRVGPVDSERPVVVTDGTAYDLTPVTADIDGDFFARGGIEMTRRALSTRSLRPIEIQGERIGAPVARPQAVVCVGHNYSALTSECGLTPPDELVVSLKHPNSIVGPFDDIRIPPGAQRVDWEVELAVIIARRAAYLDSDEEALACIAGVTIANDVCERSHSSVNSGGQWSKAKSAPTFNPLGPALVTLDSIPDLQDLRLTCDVNDEARQDATTADMVFGVAELIRMISHYLTLEPGDVVNTGTPEGVALSGRFPYLNSGDVVELAIEGLGRQRQVLVATPARVPVITIDDEPEPRRPTRGNDD